MSDYFYNKQQKTYIISMANRFTTEEVLEHLFDEGNDDIDEHFDLGSDDELEFNNYHE